MAHDIRHTLDSLPAMAVPLPAPIPGTPRHELGWSAFCTMLGTLVRFMTGIPTVIYGFVGIFFLVPPIRGGVGGPGMCVLTAGMMLAILITTMILFLRTVCWLWIHPMFKWPKTSPGANRVQRLLYVMFPRATGGMAAGITLL